jgi:MFS family permease
MARLSMAFPLSLKPRRIKLPIALYPFQDKNFAIFWVGAFLSSIGFWIQTVGQGWQVLQMTNSALLLGLVSFAATLPNIVLSLFGGAVADRFNRRLLLLGTQIVYMTTALLLGIFTALHIIAVWQVIMMALINGTVSSVGFPAWQAFIGDIVEPGQLKQGIALNSTQFNLSRVIGPAIGGLSIGLAGIAGSYYLNALSYVAVIIPLFIMRPKHQKIRQERRSSIWRGLGEGLSYVQRRPLLQIALLLQFTIAFLIFPYITLLPIYAGDIFHIGPTGLGVLNAAAGVGALTGALLLVAISQRLEHNVRFLMILCTVGGTVCLFFAFSTSLDASLLLLIVLGICTVMSTTVTNTTLQTMTPEHLRGRVLSIWVMVTFGLAPFGNLCAGWIAQSIGAPKTLAWGGTLCIVLTLLITTLVWQRKRYTRQHSPPTTNVVPKIAMRKVS